jgi:stress-induced-phosphoprotein 1
MRRKKEKALREKEAGDDDFDEGRYKRAVEHYARAAALDPGDISFPIKCAKSYFHMDQVSHPRLAQSNPIHPQFATT